MFIEFQKYIEDPLAEEIINEKLAEGDTIKLDLVDGEIKIKITKPKKKKTKPDEEESPSSEDK